jgi:hypothetical protein
MTIRACTVSFRHVRGIRHGVDVDAESLYEAVDFAVRRFRDLRWIESIGPATVLDVEMHDPVTKHSISLQQVERWLGEATASPNEAAKKAKLKMILVWG